MHVVHGTEAGGDVLRGWKEAKHEPRFVAVAVNVLDVDGALRSALTRSGAWVQRLCPVIDGNARALTVRDGFSAAVTHRFEDDRGGDAACKSSHVRVVARVERRRSEVPFDGDEAGLIRRIADRALGVATGQHHLVHGGLTRGQVAHHGGVHAVRGDADAAVPPFCRGRREAAGKAQRKHQQHTEHGPSHGRESVSWFEKVPRLNKGASAWRGIRTPESFDTGFQGRRTTWLCDPRLCCPTSLSPMNGAARGAGRHQAWRQGQRPRRDLDWNPTAQVEESRPRLGPVQRGLR